jgi:predicted transcriptional regulator
MPEFPVTNPTLKLGVRRKIHEVILSSPMVHFREIQRQLGIATGALMYHLGVLTKAGLIRSEHWGQMLRFYSVQVPDEQRRVFGTIRSPRLLRIMAMLITRPGAAHCEIMHELRIPASSTSWYIRKLLTAGVVRPVTLGKVTRYYLSNATVTEEIIRTYKPSPFDSVSENLISAWEAISATRPSKNVPKNLI